jgi:AmiR/NasT family two-component response regulator
MLTAPALIGKKVVLHEASKFTAMQLYRAAIAAGCVVVGTAYRGPVTAETVRRVKPDFVLVDIEPAAMDGLDAIAEAAADSGACLVVVSAEFLHNQELARSLGASGYLCKPFTSDMLAPALELAMRSHGECTG